MGFASRRFIVVLLTAAMLAPLGPWTSPAAAAAGPPKWSVGDFWEYERNSTINEVPLEGFRRLEVVGTERLTVGNTTHETYRLKETDVIGTPPVHIELVLTVWLRTSDLARVRGQWIDTWTVTTWTYDPPVPRYGVWPLEVGTAWDIETTFTSHIDVDNTTHSGTWRERGSVVRVEGVTVPAGTFHAYVYKRDQREGHYASLAGNFVQWSAPGGNYTEALTDYQYTNAPLDLATVTWTLFGALAAAVAAVVALGLRPPRPRQPVDKPPHVFRGDPT